MVFFSTTCLICLITHTILQYGLSLYGLLLTSDKKYSTFCALFSICSKLSKNPSLKTPYLWHCTLWVTPQSDKCLRADIKKAYGGNHVAVCVGLIACLVDQRFCVRKPASATYLSLWTGRQNLNSYTKKKE